MAAATDVNPMAPYCIGAFAVLVAVLLIYGFITKNRRKALIRSLKQGTIQPAEGGPILVEGTATGPGIELPSTGAECVFYAVRVFSKKALLEQKLSASVSSGFRSSALKGFELSALSGNFAVRSIRDGKEYVVDMRGALDKFMQGIGLVSPLVNVAVSTQMRVSDQMRHAIDLSMESKGMDSLLGVALGARTEEWTTETTNRILVYQGTSANISEVKAKSAVDSAVHIYTIGRDAPSGIMKLLAQKGVIGTLAADGDEIYVVETYITLGAKVYVVGTYSGGRITYEDTVTGLTVSYEDPETGKRT